MPGSRRLNGRYRNSAAAAAVFAGAPGPGLRPMLRFRDQLSYLAWCNLEDAVRAAAKAARVSSDSTKDASRTEPATAAPMSGDFLVHAGEGRSYAEAEADGWLAQTGWRKLERRPLAGPASVIIAEAV